MRILTSCASTISVDEFSMKRVANFGRVVVRPQMSGGSWMAIFVSITRMPRAGTVLKYALRTKIVFSSSVGASPNSFSCRKRTGSAVVMWTKLR